MCTYSSDIKFRDVHTKTLRLRIQSAQIIEHVLAELSSDFLRITVVKLDTDALAATAERSSTQLCVQARLGFIGLELYNATFIQQSTRHEKKLDNQACNW